MQKVYWNGKERVCEEDGNEREFVAYSRKLLRALKQIKKAIEEKEIEQANVLLEELIFDTMGDIEA